MVICIRYVQQLICSLRWIRQAFLLCHCGFLDHNHQQHPHLYPYQPLRWGLIDHIYFLSCCSFWSFLQVLVEFFNFFWCAFTNWYIYLDDVQVMRRSAKFQLDFDVRWIISIDLQGYRRISPKEALWSWYPSNTLIFICRGRFQTLRQRGVPFTVAHSGSDAVCCGLS